MTHTYRFEDAAAQRKAEDDAEAARPKPQRIYRPQVTLFLSVYSYQPFLTYAVIDLFV